jgi:hypothetical protein
LKNRKGQRTLSRFRFELQFHNQAHCLKNALHSFTTDSLFTCSPYIQQLSTVCSFFYLYGCLGLLPSSGRVVLSCPLSHHMLQKLIRLVHLFVRCTILACCRSPCCMVLNGANKPANRFGAIHTYHGYLQQLQPGLLQQMCC